MCVKALQHVIHLLLRIDLYMLIDDILLHELRHTHLAYYITTPELDMIISIVAEARDDKDILSDNVLQTKQLTLKDIQEKIKAPYVHQVGTEL